MADNEHREISEKNVHLGLRLAELLEKGIPVSADTLFFLRSTYGIEGEVLERALVDHSFEEWETIIELVFPPTFCIRAAVEPLLNSVKFNRQDQFVVADALAQKVSSVFLILPDATRLACAVTDQVCSIFVEKLYIHRCHDEEIVTVLNRCLAPQYAVLALVVMRCKGIKFREDTKDIFLKFVEKLAGRKIFPENLVLFLLKLLANIPGSESVEKYLFGQRKYYRKVLQDISDFSKRLEQYGMEYLLMQRYPIPHESEEEMKKNLYLLDMILDSVLEIQDPADACCDIRDLGSFDAEEDMEKMFRTLF